MDILCQNHCNWNLLVSITVIHIKSKRNVVDNIRACCLLICHVRQLSCGNIEQMTTLKLDGRVLLMVFKLRCHYPMWNWTTLPSTGHSIRTIYYILYTCTIIISGRTCLVYYCGVPIKQPARVWPSTTFILVIDIVLSQNRAKSQKAVFVFRIILLLWHLTNVSAALQQRRLAMYKLYNDLKWPISRFWDKTLLWNELSNPKKWSCEIVKILLWCDFGLRDILPPGI